ncbi:MAG TPA: DNA-binding response regulator [Lachnospiraceae bacterium]|nr:DNA-binding response regulator [Lachnospiraceae bacterium]
MRLLLIEDDPKLNHSLKYQLEKENFTVDSCTDGEEALFYINQNIHDVILLDRMLPFLDGTELLTLMRRKNNCTPVILITALGTLNDKITGLDLGADDYLVKPFEFDELLARIRCVTRRSPLIQGDDSLSLGDLILHIGESRLTGPLSSCSLSKKENELFQSFFRNPGQTLTREQLLARVWGMDTDIENGNLDNYIHFLRRRLHAVGSTVTLRTVRGIGYSMQTIPPISPDSSSTVNGKKS